MSKIFCTFGPSFKSMAKIHFRPYTTKQILLFPQRIDENIAEDDPVRLVNGLIDQLDLTSFRKLYKGYGRSPFHPRMMLKAVIYGYMNNVYSCRKIEERLKRDVHFIWLAGYEQPDFATINRFRNRVKKEINAVFTQVVLLLAERGFVSLDVEYIDGTKIESKANRYTFVWRKTVEKNRARLLEKIRVLLEQIDEVIAQDNASEQDKAEFTPELLHSMASELNAALAAEPKPTTKDEKEKHKERKKQAKELQEKADKLAEYDGHLEKLGDRNSYSKTDPDATFMRLKEDAMNNGQTKPAYNLQIGTENQFITDFMLFPNPTDTLTMIPFFSSYSSRYGRLPEESCADAGYGSEENYSFMDANDMEAYVKYNYFHKEQKKAFKDDIFRLEEPLLQQGAGLLRLSDGAAHGACRHCAYQDRKRIPDTDGCLQGKELRGMSPEVGMLQGQGPRKNHQGQPPAHAVQAAGKGQAHLGERTQAQVQPPHRAGGRLRADEIRHAVQTVPPLR